MSGKRKPQTPITGTEFGWDGSVIGGVVLNLSPDNKKVNNGRFFLTGRLYEEGSSIKGDRLWPGVPPNLRFNLRIEEAGVLTFNSGTMVGDLLESGDLDWSVTEETPGLVPKVLNSTEMAEAGVGDFTTRVYAYPIRSTWLKISLVLYPMARENLLREHKLASNKAFPGIEFKSEEVRFCPLNTGKKWGAPFLPLLMAGGNRDDFPSTPSGDEMIRKMSAILRTAIKPDCSRNMTGLKSKWESLLAAGASKLREKQVDMVWPVPRAAGTTSEQTG